MHTPTYSERQFEQTLEQELAQLHLRCFSAVKGVWQEAEPRALRADLKSLQTIGMLAQYVQDVLAPAFVRHFEQHPWVIELPCSLHEAVDALAGGKTRLPDAYLQAVFPSFWHAGDGPAARCTDPDFWRDVLRYPCGLNTTGEVYEEITLASMRKSCRVQRKTVSWFSAARALRVYEEHLGLEQETTRIWDPSGGFGARMLAAAAWSMKYEVPVTYVTCEPAKMTRGDLMRLGDALARRPGSLFEASISPWGSETSSGLPGGTFDLVFTSPPYFNTERYFDEPGQCWRDYPVWEQWKGAYLQPTARAAKQVLRSRGRLVLNVKHEADAWRGAIGEGVGDYVFPVKAGPFSRVRGTTQLNERLLVWEKP